LEGVPQLTALQREAMEYFDTVLRRPENMFCMHLEPGDLQIMCNQTMLHSRTGFLDHSEEDRKRTLYRLWLARPDSRRLPDSWEVFYGTTEPATVRGGMKGHHYDEARRYPDYGLITMSEMVGNAGRIVNSIDIPLISDSDALRDVLDPRLRTQ
jgi:hypothetical protein